MDFFTPASTFLCAAANGARSVHSFTPKLVQKHLECIRRCSPEQLEIEPLPEAQSIINTVQVQSAIKGFEKFIGIPAPDMEEMLRYAPRQIDLESWVGLLLTWESVNRGSDLFLKGLGSFDISRTYDKRVSELRYGWSMDTLRLLKAAPLRKAYKTMMAKGGGDIAAKVGLDDVRAALAC